MASLIHFIILVTRQLFRTDFSIGWPWPWRPQRSLRPRLGFRGAGLGPQPRGPSAPVPGPALMVPRSAPPSAPTDPQQSDRGRQLSRARGPVASCPHPSPALFPPRRLPPTHLAPSPPPLYGAMTVVARLFRSAPRWAREAAL